MCISGTTAQEIDYRPAPGDAIKKWDDDDLYTYVSRHLDPFQPGLTNRSLELYASSRDPEYTFTTMASDIRVTCGNHRLAALADDAMTQPVYRYVVTSWPSRSARALNVDFSAKYAFHGWDIYAFLDTYKSILSGEGSGSDRRFSEILQENVMHFVRTGRPRDAAWLTYPRAVALISDKLMINKTYHSEQCNMWRDVSEDWKDGRYSWMN